MNNLLNDEAFQRNYRRMASVGLNPRRHTATDAKAHSDLAASVAVALARANGCSGHEQLLLEQLGYAHDIGKTTGTARPQRSVELLQKIGVQDEAFLRLVKWHDVALPWYRSATRGQPPSDKAWRRLVNEVDLRLLCLFMVADRSDAPGGWRRNKPTRWFLDQARRRGKIPPALVLDLDDRPSEICAGAAVVRPSSSGPQLLVICVRDDDGFELPKGGIEWDELPHDAAVRETREETGLGSRLDVVAPLGSLQYRLANEEGGGSHLKLVRYFHLSTTADAEPSKPRRRRWISSADIPSLPLVNEALRPLLRSALAC